MPPERAEVEPPELAEPSLPVIEIDVSGDRAARAPGIADHFAAMLERTETGRAKTAHAMALRGQGAVSDAIPSEPRVSGQRIAAADRGEIGQSGRVELPSYRVTRHETHFN